MTYSNNAKIVTLLVLAVTLFAYSCGDNGGVNPDNDITMTCPPDTVVPINLSSPEEIGVYPVVTSSCMDNPTITSRDSFPQPGGLIRIWEVSDTCGNTQTCMQTIGLGAPFFHTLTIECPPDTSVYSNLSSPEQIGVYPVVTSTCMDDPVVTSRDSFPDNLIGGLIRIWEVTDTCGNMESCVQSIGLGSPFYHTLTIECPPDTVPPMGETSPEEIGVYPVVTSTCMDDPPVTSRDSTPEGMVGGFIRIWETSDTCGNSESCLQLIGLGARK